MLVARPLTHHRAARVEDREREGTVRAARYDVVEDRAVRRVLAVRDFRRHRFPFVTVGTIADRVARRKEPSAVRRVGGELTQRTDVVEDPERASVRRDDEVAVVHGDVTDRDDRHVRTQRTP